MSAPQRKPPQSTFLHNEIVSAVDAEIVEETLTDGSTVYNVEWNNAIDSRIVIACCDGISARRLVKCLNDDTVGFDVVQQ